MMEVFKMFDNKRYLTRGINTTIPPPLQAILWNLIDLLPPERDYHDSEPLDGVEK